MLLSPGRPNRPSDTNGFESLLIDLDGTLIDSASGRTEAIVELDKVLAKRFETIAHPLGHTIGAVLNELWPGEPFGREFRQLGFARTDALWVDFNGSGPSLSRIRAWAPGFRARFWKTVCERIGLPESAIASELGHRFVEERYARIRPFPGVERALGRLAGEFRLVLLSNGPSDLQRVKLDRTNLAHFFDSLVISGELAIAKPDPRIFRHALSASYSTATRTLMVGDDWRNDVLGARWVGIDAVFVASSRASKRELSGQDRINDVPVIGSFSDLPDLLGEP